MLYYIGYVEVYLSYDGYKFGKRNQVCHLGYLFRGRMRDNLVVFKERGDEFLNKGWDIK